jgi:acyl-CoA thioester hydrolase
MKKQVQWVVYYAKYLVWMEVGRVGLLRDIGIGYTELVRHEIRFPVVQARAAYRAPGHVSTDEIMVKTKIASIGNKSIRFENEIYKLPQKHLATGHTIHALTRKAGNTIPP